MLSDLQENKIYKEWHNNEELKMQLKQLQNEYRKSEGEKRILYVARGRAGNRWFYDSRVGYSRMVDPYAENIPEALIEWCRENSWKLFVVYDGILPEFNETDLGFQTRFPDICRELSTRDIFPIFPRRTDIVTEFQKHYSEVLMQDLNFQDAFSYEGVPLFDTLSDQLKHLPSLAAGHVHSVELWTAMLEVLQPEVVFSGRLDIRPNICVASSRLGIMTVGIKLGIAEEMLAPFAIRDDAGKFDPATFPDVLAIWGETQRKLLNQNFPDCPATLVISGRTRNDTFFGIDELGSEQNSGQADLHSIRKYLDIDPDTKLLVYGANYATKFGKASHREFGACCMSPYTYWHYLECLVALCETRQDVCVIVKPHPADDLQFISEIIAEMEGRPVYLLTDDSGFHNSQILSQASVFLSSVSSMFAESVLAGCPAVNLWNRDVNYLYESGRQSAFDPISITLTNIAEMEKTVIRLLDDEVWRKSQLDNMTDGLSLIFGSGDGGNARRAVDGAMQHFEKEFSNLNSG